MIDGDLAARIELASHEPAPLWAASTLGGRPDQPDLAAVWDGAVGEVNQYRTIHAITDIDEPLGPRPDRLDPDHYAWTDPASTLSHAVQQLGRQDQLDPYLRHDLGLDHNEELGLGISR